jgi:hypothetical protein
MSRGFLARAARSLRSKPTVEIHIPISPTPTFFNMVQCLSRSLRKLGGAFRDAPIVLTVGGSTIDPGLEARYPWLGPLGVEVRWVPEAFFREHSIYATGATRFEHDYRSDVVLFLDADILVAGPIDEMVLDVHRRQQIAGMIAPASPLQFLDPPMTWQAIYDHCGIGRAPDLCHEHPGWPYYRSGDEAYRLCPAYFNYGVICAPARLLKRIGESYFSYLLRLRELTDCELIAQLALTMPIVKHNLPYRPLRVRYNFPNHPMLEALHGAELPHAKLLHMKEDHQFQKFDLFADLASIRAAIRRTDLRGINEIARRVLQAIEPRLIEACPPAVAAA